MRVLLRNCKTGLYYGPEGSWVASAEALAFGSSTEAVHAGLDFRGQPLEIVLSFEDPKYDLSIPFRAKERPRLGSLGGAKADRGM